MTPAKPLAAAVILLVAVLPFPGHASPAEPLEVRVEDRLPGGNYRAASVETGGAIYIIGGRNETDTSPAVMRYDPSNGAVSFAAFRLPQPRMSACAVYDGKYAYVLGGADGGLELGSILRIELGTGEVRTLEAQLPSPRIGLSAALQDGRIYIFGGHSNGTKITHILRFDPATGNMTVMGASLPGGRAGMAIASAGSGIHLFGGKTDTGASDEVLLYEPEEDRLSVLPDRLPYTVYHAPAVLFRGAILIIGGNARLPGWNVSKATDTIVVFDPATGISSLLKSRLPSPRERTVAAVMGGRVLVFGGQEGVRALDEVVSLGPARKDGARTPDGWTPVLQLAILLGGAATAAAAIRRRKR